MNPKVSIIIPVYNTQAYLAECLNSTINQTIRDIEIIVVNDASPDHAVDIIRDFQEKDSRIRLIDKKNNEGVGKARNDGIAAAKGEFVAFLDSDDLYPNSEVLEHLYKAAEENQVKIAGGKVEHLFEDAQVELINYPKTEYGMVFSQNGLMRYEDYQYDYGYTQYIYKREMLLNNKITFPYYSRFQDPPFFVRAMFAGKEYYFTDEPVYRYRMVGGASKYTLKKTIDMLTGVMDNLRFSRENDLPKLYCLSANRLNKEGSYMAIQNLYEPENEMLLAKLIEANQAVDVKWLKEKGFDFPDPFVLDAFKYAVDTAGKYENLRDKKLAKLVRKLVRK